MLSKENIKEVLSKVVAECKLTKWCYSIQEFENIAQNYFGVLIPVILSGKCNDTEKNIRLLLKLAPKDEKYRVSGALTLFFSREIFMYTTLLKKYEELQKSLLLPQYIIPKCYYVCKEYCNEAIVMQDMREFGYTPYNDMFLDFNHATVSLKALAKFHALSFIMREMNPIMYKESEAVCLPLTEINNSRFMNILNDRLMKAMDTFKDAEYVSLLQHLNQNCVNFIEMAFNSVKGICICHGDIWKENILYKYENNMPISACIIDYQTVRMCSPAFDTLFLITSSTSSDLRSNHFLQMLDVYYQTLDHILRKAKLNPKVIYSRQNFFHDLKVVGPACFIVANTALWLSNGLQQEGHVRSKHVPSTEEEKRNAIAKYKAIVKGILEDFSCYGYLNVFA